MIAMSLFSRLKTWAKALKRDVIALWIAARDPRTPWYAKAVAGGVAAYAMSPIDFIPDFVPIIGLLDDVLIVPLGIALAVKMIPAPLMAEFRVTAVLQSKPVSRAGLASVIVVWATFAGLAGWWIRARFMS